MSSLAKAGITAGLATASAALLYDTRGPDPRKGKTVQLRDFSVPAQKNNTMSIVRSTDRVKAVTKAIELLGGITRFIKSGDRVVIKPNVAFASPPMLGATTNPDIITQVIKLCYNAGAKSVTVIDNPINDPQSCFKISGIAKASLSSGAKIIYPTENQFAKTTLKNAELIRNWPIFFQPLKNADKLIGIAPVKDHHRSGASMTMKNWYGLLGGRRNIFHQDINTIIAELAAMVKPTLVILDGAQAMISNGPTGGSISDLKTTNTLIASCDQVAADSYGCSLLQMKIEQLGYLRKAQNAGTGTTDYNSLKPKFATLNGEQKG